MPEIRQADKFIYIHDDYDHCKFCAETYQRYRIYEYGTDFDSFVIDITFHDKKMKKLGYVVDAQYEMTYFIAQHPRLLKKEGIPHNPQTYAQYLKEYHLQSINAAAKDSIEKDYDDLIKSKVESMKKSIFPLKDVPQNEAYLKECIAESPDKFLFGIKIRPGKICAARINKDDSSGIDNYQNFDDLKSDLKNTIISLNPKPSFNVLAAYYLQEEFDEDDIRQFLFAGKKLIENTNEFIYLKDAEFEALIENVACLCHLWKEKKKISKKFFEEANNFILYRRNTSANPVVDFIGLFFDSLIDDMKANHQLIECAHCRLLARYFRNKKFCNKTTDGRNCFGQYHSKKDYSRHKTKRLKAKREWIKKARKEIPGY
ncbi:MAG TPA: hypothetical protein VI749_08935 [Candidatus Omnitrophota bacterium]|nr:hypothetical protein [Candidatus Omnitrophota bacterium]